MKGYLAFVLHSHLPYVVGHGRWPHGAEWLHEATAETYIPILKVLNKLAEEGIRPAITIGITPVLQEQLRDPRFKSGFKEYVKNKIESAKNDQKEFAKLGFKRREKVAHFWIDFYSQTLEYFEKINEDILGQFKKLQDEGQIEIITSAATHGYLPLLLKDESVDLQVRVGREAYLHNLGVKPEGIWPPELAYRPAYRWKPPVGEYPEYDRAGVEEFYSKYGINYFLVDQHLLKGGKAIGTYLSIFEGLKALWEKFQKEVNIIAETERKPYKPYYAISPNRDKPVGFFTRDPESALQVWSRDWGYPGNPNYLEFHKRHFPGGHKYWRVTDPKADLAAKEEYDPEATRGPLEEQSEHFVGIVEGIVASNQMDERPPIVVSPYDSELFGHWWFEGPEWLYLVIKKLNARGNVKTVTLSEYFEKYPPIEVVTLPEGSWGEGGFHWVWLNENTEWTWKHIYSVESRIYPILDELKAKGGDDAQLLWSLLVRQLLLLQASDWQFLITTWSARDYAEARFSMHKENIEKLMEIARNFLREGKLSNRDFLQALDEKAPLFKEVLDKIFKE